MKVSELELDLGTIAIHCTTEEIATTIGALLREMRRMIPRLRPDELEVLRRIMSRESGVLTVAQVFPEFTRESEQHMTLRRLRAAQFIRPARTGRWDRDEQIEVKPFARLMWDRVGEGELLAEKTEPRREPTAAAKPVAEKPIAAKQSIVDDDEEEVILDLNDYPTNAEGAEETPNDTPFSAASPESPPIASPRH